MAVPVALSAGGRNTSSSKLQSSNFPSPTGALPGQRATRSVGVGLAVLAGVSADNGEASPTMYRLIMKKKWTLFISFICSLRF